MWEWSDLLVQCVNGGVGGRLAPQILHLQTRRTNVWERGTISRVCDDIAGVRVCF